MTPDFRAALAARLRGQIFIVPDVLRTIYKNSSSRLNDTDFLTRRLDAWLEKYVPTVSQRSKQRKVDAPLYPATSGIAYLRTSSRCSVP